MTLADPTQAKQLAVTKAMMAGRQKMCRTITLPGTPVLRVRVAPIPRGGGNLRAALRGGNMILITEGGVTRALQVTSRKEERA